MRLPNILIPVLFLVEGWLVAAIILTFFPITGMITWWVPILAGLLFASAMSLLMKRRLVRVHQSHETMVPTTPDRHPGIDLVALGTMSAQFAALGFDQQIDYTVQRTPPSEVDGFARLFYHPGAHVIAEVNQVMLRGVAATAMASTLFSLFEDDWSLSTMTRPPTRNTAIIYALRRPKRLWQIAPGAGPEMAFGRHTSAVELLSRRFPLKPVGGDPVEAYLASQERQKVERYELSKRRNLFAFLLDIDRYGWAPKLEWMGSDSV
jgi:hypothetical protein